MKTCTTCTWLRGGKCSNMNVLFLDGDRRVSDWEFTSEACDRHKYGEWVTKVYDLDDIRHPLVS